MELSKEYWKAKQQNGTPRIKWKVLKKCHTYNQKKRHCILCLNGKYEIACSKGDKLLNKKTEFLGTCRHRNKNKLEKLRLKRQTSYINLITSLKIPYTNLIL